MTIEKQIRKALEALCGHYRESPRSHETDYLQVWECPDCLPRRIAAMSRSYTASSQCDMTPEDEDAAAMRALRGEIA